MIEDWKSCKLICITKKIGSGATPRGGSNSYKKNGISLIRSQNVLDLMFSKSGLVFIDDAQASKLKNVRLEKDDILLNITGDSVARVCMVPEWVLPARVNQHVAIIRTEKVKVNTFFLLYSLIHLKPYLLGISEIGGTRRALTKAMIEELVIRYPILPEQNVIASILTSLDDKIDLLHRQNRTLEEMGEVLFREWFVERAETGWDIGILDNMVDIGIGRTPPRKESQWFSTNIEDVKWVSIKDMGASGLFISNTAEFLTNEAIERFNVPRIPINTVLLSFKMTVGRVAISTEEMLSNEAIAHFKFKESTPFTKEFLYYFLKTYQYQKLGSTSSIVTSINSRMIKEMEVTIPSKKNLTIFDDSVSPLFSKIKFNQEQIETLESLRDTLLPKLMSGEVRVKV